MCILILDARSYLPFLDFGTNASVLNSTLDYAEGIQLPSDITFGNVTYNISYVSLLVVLCGVFCRLYRLVHMDCSALMSDSLAMFLRYFQLVHLW